MRLYMAMILSTIMLMGCSSTEKAENKLHSNIQTRANATIKEGTRKVYRREGPFETENIIDEPEEFDMLQESTSERADKIAKVVTDLEGIKKASVVISGNNALVGIELTEELNDKNLIKNKKEVEKVVKSTDKKIKQVAVTVADQLVQRINKMADSIHEDDESVPKYSDETEDILKMLTPVV